MYCCCQGVKRGQLVVIHYITRYRETVQRKERGDGIITSEGKMRMRERKEMELKERNKLSG